MDTPQRIVLKRIKCQKKFLKYFRNGFQDSKYLDWERSYKEDAHVKWHEKLGKRIFNNLIKEERYTEIASIAIGIESRTNLLFSFEKMAIRDAVKSGEGAALFAKALYNYVYGIKPLQSRFEDYVKTLSLLPRIQTRVVTWPVSTVFGFIANPVENIFLKPRVTQAAANAYGFEFHYSSKVIWDVYRQVLDFAAQLRHDLTDWMPKDMIDIQSFMWVLGSDEYP